MTDITADLALAAIHKALDLAAAGRSGACEYCLGEVEGLDDGDGGAWSEYGAWIEYDDECAPEPGAYGVYADVHGDVWRHDEAGWQVVESSTGEGLAAISFPMDWADEAEHCAPFELIRAPELGRFGRGAALRSSAGLPEAGWLTVDQAARVISNDYGVTVGRGGLRRLLAEWGWTDENGYPSAGMHHYAHLEQEPDDSLEADLRISPAGVVMLGELIDSVSL